MLEDILDHPFLRRNLRSTRLDSSLFCSQASLSLPFAGPVILQNNRCASKEQLALCGPQVRGSGLPLSQLPIATIDKELLANRGIF